VNNCRKSDSLAVLHAAHTTLTLTGMRIALCNTMDKEPILNGFDFYADASPSFQFEIRSVVRPVTLEAGSYFYHEGESCPNVALIGMGNIRVFKTADNGRQITLYHLRENETCLVNMLCAILQKPSPASAQAETTVYALAIPATKFREWIGTNEEIRNHVFHRMSARIVEVMMLVEEVAFHKMDQRIAAYLLQRFSNATLAITHEEIAIELGTAREVVSRVLKDFERHGAIAIARNRLEMLNESKLREMCDSGH
jgi:CRP/FNR family transcriptional regulator